MLIELVTPLVLATAPTMLDAQSPIYSHETQQVVSFKSGSGETTVGFGSSTRTYDAVGKPFDSDMD